MGPQDEHPLATDSVSPESAVPRAYPDFLKSFLLNLLAGCRLALMLPVKRGSFRITIDQVVLLILFSVALQAAIQFNELPPVREVSIIGLTCQAAFYAVVIFAAYCVVVAQRASSSLTPFLGMLVSTLPLYSAVRGFVWAVYPPDSWTPLSQFIITIVGMVWLPIVAFRIVRVLHGARRFKALSLAIGFAVVFLVPATLLPQFKMWTSLGPPGVAGDEGSSAAYRPIDVEGAYYRQARLLDDALKTLHRNRPGIADLYFVGFGGYARQDVFLREVQAVRGLFDQRFDTANRSVALVNNPATLEDIPLANAHNLERVLGDMARRMDTEEDILFLFLTSHGSRDHRLSADFWPLRLNDLPAVEIADILDRTGIKWRVIVVSACYSGGFIDSLADENSLIMTASRRDRNSFGCAHENEWTYFGQAYFDEQLRTEYSFTAAFEAAAEAIAVREQEEELTPSEPQIHVGSAIAGRLEALRARIEIDDNAANSN